MTTLNRPGSSTSYTLYEELGRGSYGKVYRATDTHNNEFAIKTINLEELCKDQREVININREVNILASLRHAHIINRVDSWQTTTDVYIVTDYYENKDLWQYVNSTGTPSEPQLILWIHQIAQALQHIHDRGYIHRNVKPQNVMVTSDILLKLGDFGTARLLPANNVAETVIGTPYFMSPEMMRQQPYSTATDIWSFGCLCYALCSGHILHDGNTFSRLNHSVQHGIQFKELFCGLPYTDELKRLIAGMLASSACDRPTAEDILHVIEEFSPKYGCDVADSTGMVSSHASFQDIPVKYAGNSKHCREVTDSTRIVSPRPNLRNKQFPSTKHCREVTDSTKIVSIEPKFQNEHKVPLETKKNPNSFGTGKGRNKLPPVVRSVSVNNPQKHVVKKSEIPQIKSSVDFSRFPDKMDLSKTCPAAIWYTPSPEATPRESPPPTNTLINNVNGEMETEEYFQTVEIIIQQFLAQYLGEDVYMAGVSCLLSPDKDKAMNDLENAIGKHHFRDYSIFFMRMWHIYHNGNPELISGISRN